jgi:hypothetical protein
VGKVDDGVENGEGGSPPGADGVFWDSIEEKSKEERSTGGEGFRKVVFTGCLEECSKD